MRLRWRRKRRPVRFFGSAYTTEQELRERQVEDLRLAAAARLRTEVLSIVAVLISVASLVVAIAK